MLLHDGLVAAWLHGGRSVRQRSVSMWMRQRARSGGAIPPELVLMTPSLCTSMPGSGLSPILPRLPHHPSPVPPRPPLHSTSQPCTRHSGSSHSRRQVRRFPLSHRILLRPTCEPHRIRPHSSRSFLLGDAAGRLRAGRAGQRIRRVDQQRHGDHLDDQPAHPGAHHRDDDLPRRARDDCHLARFSAPPARRFSASVRQSATPLSADSADRRANISQHPTATQMESCCGSVQTSLVTRPTACTPARTTTRQANEVESCCNMYHRCIA